MIRIDPIGDSRIKPSEAFFMCSELHLQHSCDVMQYRPIARIFEGGLRQCLMCMYAYTYKQASMQPRLGCPNCISQANCQISMREGTEVGRTVVG